MSNRIAVASIVLSILTLGLIVLNFAVQG